MPEVLSPLKYDIYIAYENSKYDKMMAKKVLKSIKKYRIPSSLKVKESTFDRNKIYLENESNLNTENINKEIKDILITSKFLIIICSPQTLPSKRIDEEIAFFRENRNSDNILSVLIKGEPYESFPKQLLIKKVKIKNKYNEQYTEYYEKTEPLVADIRADSPKKSLKILKTERLRLLAPIISCSFDNLKRRHRERKIKKITSILFIALIFIFSFGLISYNKWQFADKQRRKAENTTKIALEILNNMYIKVPERFHNNPNADIIAKTVLLDNLEELSKAKYIDSSKYIISAVLESYPDTFDFLCYKAIIYRNFNMIDKSLSSLSIINELYPNRFPNQDIYINTAKIFASNANKFGIYGGVFIFDITPNETADKNGLKLGDIIIKTDELETYNASHFDYRVNHAYPQKKDFTITFLRLNKKGKFDLKTKKIKKDYKEFGAKVKNI